MLFEHHCHGVKILDQHQSQSLTEEMIVLVVSEVSDHLFCLDILNVETRTRNIHLHKVPNIYQRHKLAIKSTWSMVTS